MKKINNKGFMLTEILIVSIFVTSVLIFLYIQFKNVNRVYDRGFTYNTVMGSYATNNVRIFLDNDVYYEELDENYTNYLDDVTAGFNGDNYVVLYEDDPNDSTKNCSIVDSDSEARHIMCGELMRAINAKTVVISKENSRLFTNYINTNFSEGFKTFISNIDNNYTNTEDLRIIIEFNDDTYSSMLYIVASD